MTEAYYQHCHCGQTSSYRFSVQPRTGPSCCTNMPRALRFIDCKSHSPKAGIASIFGCANASSKPKVAFAAGRALHCPAVFFAVFPYDADPLGLSILLLVSVRMDSLECGDHIPCLPEDALNEGNVRLDGGLGFHVFPATDQRDRLYGDAMEARQP